LGGCSGCSSYFGACFFYTFPSRIDRGTVLTWRFVLCREESENASELTSADDAAAPAASSARLGLGPDALGVHNQIGIRSFADAYVFLSSLHLQYSLLTIYIPTSRRSDIANERLPEFDPSASPGVFPTPSMRVLSRRGSGDTENMEVLIKRTLEENDDEYEEGGLVEKLADKIAKGRRVTGRPRGLKRHETA